MGVFIAPGPEQFAGGADNNSDIQLLENCILLVQDPFAEEQLYPFGRVLYSGENIPYRNPASR